MTNTAFIVDGDLEKKFLHNVCKGAPVKKVGNGDNCPSHVIAKQAALHIRLMKDKYHNIVVLVDLEKRAVSAASFRDDLSQKIRDLTETSTPIHVFVKDRCVEDWILADHQAVHAYVGGNPDLSNASGKGGLKSILKEHDIIYNETTTGVDLLRKVHCSRARLRSPTLENICTDFPIDCWWLAR